MKLFIIATLLLVAAAPASAQEPRLLYAPMILSQALDLHSTFKAIDRGAVEGNPIMRGAITNKPVAIAIKAGIIGAVIGLAERDRKHRKAWFLLVAGITGVQFAIDARNYRMNR